MIRNAWPTAAGIRSGELAAVDVISAALARIAELDAGLNAFTVVAAETALAQAAEVDRGERSGAPGRVPISVKDHIWVRGLPATNGSRSLPLDLVCTSGATSVRLQICYTKDVRVAGGGL